MANSSAGAGAGAPRIAPGGRGDVGLPTWLLPKLMGLVTKPPPANLLLTLGRHRALFRAWLRFSGRLMPRGLLARRETELVILRVAHLRGSQYEYEQHVRIGRRAGLTDADLARVAVGPGAEGWSPRERALLAATDELDRDGDLSDAAWSGLREHLDERACIELCMLAGHYEMLATVIAALRVQPDVAAGRTSGSAASR
jgi:alkylhydroperoxidase family enzyme